MTVKHDLTDVLVLDCAEDSESAGIRLVVEHQLVMSGELTGRELVIGVQNKRGPGCLIATLDRHDAEALRDWISARLASGEIR